MISQRDEMPRPISATPAFAVATSCLLAGAIFATSARADEPVSERTEPSPDTVPLTLVAQPLDRWIQVGATFLRDIGASKKADEFALLTRAVAGGLKIDSTRPLLIHGDYRQSFGEDGAIDPTSIRILLPTPSASTKYDGQRLLIDKSGVRTVADTSAELSKQECYVSAADRWALLTRDKTTANEATRQQSLAALGNGPAQLLTLHLGNGVMPIAYRKAIVAKLWADIDADLKQQPDEPNNVFALRSSAQTAIGQTLERLILELDEVEISLDVPGEEGASTNGLVGTLDLRWTQDGQVADALSRFQPAPSTFEQAMSVAPIARLEVHFKLPPAIARRVARFAESAATVAQSIGDSAGRPDWLPVVDAFEASVVPALSDGQVDFFVDLIRIDQNIAVHGALKLDGRELIKTGLRAALADQADQLTRRQAGGLDFVGFGSAGSPANSPFGVEPQLWLATDDRACWFAFGSVEAVDLLAQRASATRRVLNATSTTSQRESSADSPDRATDVLLASLEIRHEELRDAIQQYPNRADLRDLAAILTNVDNDGPYTHAELSASDHGVGLSIVVPGTIAKSLGRAFASKSGTITE